MLNYQVLFLTLHGRLIVNLYTKLRSIIIIKIYSNSLKDYYGFVFSTKKCISRIV